MCSHCGRYIVFTYVAKSIVPSLLLSKPSLHCGVPATCPSSDEPSGKSAEKNACILWKILLKKESEEAEDETEPIEASRDFPSSTSSVFSKPFISSACAFPMKRFRSERGAIEEGRMDCRFWQSLSASSTRRSPSLSRSSLQAISLQRTHCPPFTQAVPLSSFTDPFGQETDPPESHCSGALHPVPPQIIA